MRVGLTGSIATGKSTVARYFKQKGIPVIDADEVAKEVVEVGKPGWKSIREHFEEEVFLSNGEINRQLLASIVFHDEEQRQKLNQLLHPIIFEEVNKAIRAYEKQGASMVVIDMPLLFETGYDRQVEEVIVVYVPEAIQLERFMRRNGFSYEEAIARVKTQLSIEEKKKRATTVIDNSRSLQETYRQIDQWILEKMK